MSSTNKFRIFPYGITAQLVHYAGAMICLHTACPAKKNNKKLQISNYLHQGKVHYWGRRGGIFTENAVHINIFEQKIFPSTRIL